MTDYTGQRFGNYRLIRVLGKGSFADVYLSKHIHLKTEAAIKVFCGQLDIESIEHFLTEARHLHFLEHPHIIRVHDFGIDDDASFLVMDYAPGGTLRERHPKGELLPLSLVISYVQQIASALDYAHDNKLIHRDLKPENLLLDSREQILLSDFGVALPLRSTESISTQAIGGTLAYMAPEQIRGKPRRESDQYAIGIMVYEWLCGQRPFHGTTAELCGQHLFVPPPSMREPVPDLSPAIEQVVFRALAKEPGERFATMEAFAEALAQTAQGTEPTPLFTKHAPAGPVETPRGLSHLWEAPYTREAQKKRFTHLPASLTSLVGRDSEQRAACVLLMRPEVRLLTITGPGGIGKTRLSLAVAHDLIEILTGGACFVELAAISNPDQVLASIVQTLNLKESSESSLLDSLKTFLRDKPFLLVLDNFEQVIDAAPLLFDLLTSCPELTLLVTSREVLHVPGEQCFPLAPLDLPTSEHLKDATALAQCASIALFVQRAQIVRPEFQITEANKQVIAEICTRLDGLPLAVELAAARIKLLSPQEVFTRLSRRLDFLSTSARTAPARQQTVRKAIAWSYELLSPAEQCLFRRLTVFVGGFTLSDIESLYKLLGEDTLDVLDDITSLVDKSLISRQKLADEESHLSALETIREFGLEALANAGELEATRAAHAAHCLLLIAEVESSLLHLPIGQGMDLFKREYRNLQTALHFLRESQQMEGALRLAAVLGAVGVWFLGGYMTEAVDLLKQTLAANRVAPQSVSSRTEAVALLMLGWIAIWSSNLEEGLKWYEESLAHFRRNANKHDLAIQLAYISHCYREIGDYHAEEQAIKEGLALANEIGDQICIIRLLGTRLIGAFIRGDWAQIRVLAQEHLPLLRERGDLWFEAFTLHYLGWAAYSQQSYDEAADFGEKSVALFQLMGYPVMSAEALTQYAYEVAALKDTTKADALLEEALGVSLKDADKRDQARVLCGQGRMALRRGDLAQARTLYEESVRLISSHIYLEKRHRYIPASCLEGLAEIAIAQGEAAWAARLLGAAEAVRGFEADANTIGQEQPFFRRTYAIAQADLREASFEEAFSEGKSLTALQALTAQKMEERSDARAKQATTETGELTKTATTKVPSLTSIQHPPADLTQNLTNREQEVLQLLAEGLSNAEIARNLVLSVVTINSYLRSIYSKLGVSSRTRAVRYALDTHLI